MKKTIVIFALLIVSFFNRVCVAGGEAALTEKLRKAGDSARIGLVTEDAVYVMGETKLYIWRDGEKDMTAYMGSELPGRPVEAFMRNGDLWMIIYDPFLNRTTELTLARVVPENNGGYAVPETVKFSMPIGSILPGEDLDITSAVCVGDMLYMLADPDHGNAQLWVFDWRTGESLSIREGDLGRRLFAAPGDCVLVECMDREKGTAWYEIYDHKTRSFAPHGGVFDFDRMNDAMVGAAWDSTNDILYYQKDGMLKCAVGFDPGMEENVTSVTHQVDDMSVYAGITAKKDYVFLTREGPVVIDLVDSLGRTVTFKVVMPSSEEAVIKTLEKMEERHSDVMTAVDSEKYTDQQLAGQFQTFRDDADIYVLEADNIFPMMLYFRDYLTEITDPEVRASISKMYPAVRNILEINGKICAVPVSVEGDTLGFDRDVLEQLDGKDAELPNNFTDLAQKLKELNIKCGDHDEYSVFPLEMTQDSVRAYLLFYIMSVYGKKFMDDPATGFSTPELNAALNALMELDLDEMGINEESRSANNEYVMPLIVGGASTVCEQYDRNCEPLPLTVFPGQKPILPIDMKVAIINPNSGNMALAQEFMAELPKHLDDTTLYTVSGEKNTPIPDPQMQGMLQDGIEQQTVLLGMIKDAKGIQKEEMEDALNAFEDMTEKMKQTQWKLSQESIDRFRANADKIYIETYNYALTGDATSLLRSLLDRRITVEEFTKELDRRTQMAIREGL